MSPPLPDSVSGQSGDSNIGSNAPKIEDDVKLSKICAKLPRKNERTELRLEGAVDTRKYGTRD